jgi:hypothetical protein
MWCGGCECSFGVRQGLGSHPVTLALGKSSLCALPPFPSSRTWRIGLCHGYDECSEFIGTILEEGPEEPWGGTAPGLELRPRAWV